MKNLLILKDFLTLVIQLLILLATLNKVSKTDIGEYEKPLDVVAYYVKERIKYTLLVYLILRILVIILR